MRTKRDHEGYLLIDHRACPGITGAPVSMFESATITCSHCHRIVILNPDRSRARGYCRRCDHYVCDQCTGTDCIPMNKVLDDLQEQALQAEQSDAPLILPQIAR